MRILMLLLLLAQEPSKIDKLIDELGHDAFATRDNAAKALVKIGVQAIPALKTAERSLDAEVRCRATAILAEIEFNRKLFSVCQPLPSLTYRADNESASTVLEEFKRQTGITLTGLKVDKLSVSWNATPVMAALDDLSAQAKVAWEWSGESAVNFSFRPNNRWSSVYQDGFKISVLRTDSYRSWDGAGGHGILWLYLGVQVDPGIKCQPPKIQYDLITDGGKALDVDVSSIDTIIDSFNKRLFVASPVSMTHVDNTLRSVSVKGRAIFTFVIATKEVEITAPFQNPITIGDFTIAPNNVGASCPGIMVTKAGEETSVYKFIDRDSFEVESVSGETPRVQPDFTAYSRDTGMIQLSFPESEHVEMKKIKFRLFTEFITQEIPFNFNKVEFP